MNKNIKIYIPYNTKIILWKNNKITNEFNLILTNSTKFYKLGMNIKKDDIFIDKWCNTINLNKKIYRQNDLKVYKFFCNFLKSWDSYFYNKIKFKGKGFRIRFFKKIKLIKFYFGRSHKTFFLLKKIKRKRINKYKFLLIGLNKQNVSKNRTKIIKIKPINIYTLRGIRCSKQIIFKRKGKKGTYI